MPAASDPSTTHRCDVVSTLSGGALVRHGIVDHDAGADPYVVTEPTAFGGRTRRFCSLWHLALWLRTAAAGADKRADGRARPQRHA